MGQITPAEPYKNTVLTIFEMALPVRGDYTSVLPNTNDYVTFFTRYIELPSYYLHLEHNYGIIQTNFKRAVSLAAISLTRFKYNIYRGEKSIIA